MKSHLADVLSACLRVSIGISAASLRAVLAVAAIVATVFAVPANAALIGINSAGNIFSIDGMTGSISLVGASGISAGTPNSMAKDNAGTLFTATDQLFTIDPVTGAATTVVGLPLRGRGLRGMAFDSSDTLFGVDSVPDITVNDVLVTVDTTTGAVTTIGTDLGFSGIQGLAFAPDGVLYAWDVADGLLTIDLLTGVATDINNSVAADANIQSLAFDASGVLYGARNDLFSIDLSTGISTLVGSGNSATFDIRGIETVIPIPPAVYLFSTGLLGLIGIARRRKLA